MAKRPTRPTNTSEDPATSYARSVVSGEMIAGPHVRNACRRHLDDLIKGKERGLIWDVTAVERFIGYCRDVLRLNGGQFEGRPFILEPSQAFIAGSLFGWKRTNENGKVVRRFRRAYIEQAKGQGKSPFAGAVGLYCMTADGEAAAEIYAAGKDKAQAMVLFRDSVAMYDQSPKLKRELTPSGGNPVWNLAHLKSRSFFRPISREGAHSGPRPYVALCDEIHEHPDGKVIEMLERGFKFRDQPLLLMITNSGSDRNSICWAEHQHAVKVAAGTQTPDDDFTYVGDVFGSSDEAFSYVCALDKDDDPITDPSCWIKANPLLGVTLKYEYIEGVVAQAKDIPSKRNGILRLHFCVWTEADTAWIPRPIIEKVMADFDPYEEHKGKQITSAGLDLSGAKDLTAAAFVVETGTKRVKREDGEYADLPTYDLWIEAWTPRDTMDERSKVDHVPYRVWNETYYPGTNWPYIHAPEGARVRYDHVAALFARLNAEHGVGVLAFDRYAYDKFEQELDDYGVEIKTIAHPQGGKKRAKPDEEKVQAAKDAGLEPPLGLWMPGSVSALETLILEERIRMRRSPVLLGALMGVAIETDPLMGNQWFSKKKSTVRIDPAVASAMAIGAAVDGPAASGPDMDDFINNMVMVI
ncbi:terminase large subunit [Agrobacterium vaccinii]|uniref:terminase large subunit n=1 Tax=Agrobacterium vaccinii TaxID=2735528 RepID=UPI001E30AA77|nr:terminase TerL endonuclease subunit [Agrobacterium vaccinii]UHS61042.1 terminase large subunit [Agrobacterium vaccinii]